MATWYVDREGGNDANTGTSFAQRLKNLSAVTAGKGYVAGETIRLMACPAASSVGSVTWTNASGNLTIPAGLTLNISTCETAWTASANVTSTADATVYKEGSNSAKHVIAAGFATGLVSYIALGGATDFSTMKQVSFWIRSSAATASGVYTITLCSDAVGAVAVNTISVPAIGAANRWQAVTVDTGGALGASIQSVALNALSDPGAVTVWLDNILA